MSSIKFRLALCVATTVMLAACGGGSSAPAPAASTAAAPAAPASPALAKLYQQTCHNCHAIPGTGAPQTGDKNAWAPRIAQGRESLLDHSINGFKSMPPMGTCTQCTEEEFVGLIEFMSGAQLK